MVVVVVVVVPVVLDGRGKVEARGLDGSGREAPRASEGRAGRRESPGEEVEEED